MHSGQWKEGDRVTHPQFGEGVVQKVFFWESKQESCLRIEYGSNGHAGWGSDQENLEKQGWRLKVS